MKPKMKIKRFLSLVLTLILVLNFSACRKNGAQNDQNITPELTPEDELVIYHNNTALAPMLISLTEEYSKATGKTVSAKLSGSNFMGEMQSKNAAIYVVDTHYDLSDWHSEGLFSDFLNGSGLSSLFTKIPAGLQLNSTGIGSYGVPLMLEGYGYIFDREMISALFGSDSAESLINDLRTCSFTEFESFVAAVDTYISAPSKAEITIGGNKYSFLPEKTEKAATLTGVFSLNSESTRVMEHLLSYALSAKFASRYEVMNAAEENISGASEVLSAYMEVLDLHTSHIAGAEGSIGRGDEFTGGDYNYSTSIDLFTRGNALFYPGGTSDTADFEKSAAGFSNNLDIIPMKLPITDEQITAAGMTAEKLQSSIVIGSRYYITVNPKADEKSTAAAMDFINWLYSDEVGKTAYSSAFGTVPFNYEYLLSDSNMAKTAPESEPMPEENPMPETPEISGPMVPSHNISNSLMAAVGEYYSAGNWIPDMSVALPSGFAEEILGKNLSDYWGMETWAESDRKNFVDTIIGGWKERLNKNTVG